MNCQLLLLLFTPYPVAERSRSHNSLPSKRSRLRLPSRQAGSTRQKSLNIQLWTVHWKTVHCLLNTVHCQLSLPTATAHWALITVHCPLFTVHCPLFTVHCSLPTVHCSLFTDHWLLPTGNHQLLLRFQSLQIGLTVGNQEIYELKFIAFLQQWPFWQLGIAIQ